MKCWMLIYIVTDYSAPPLADRGGGGAEEEEIDSNLSVECRGRAV